MLYFIIQGVIDNHNISKEHKMHFTNVVIVYDSPYYEIQHRYDKVNYVLLYYEIIIYVSI